MANDILTQELIKDLFDYRNGVLYWKVRLLNQIQIGDSVGCVNNNGYLATSIKGKKYLNHRLIFLMFYGYLPTFIDHVDNNPLNNRIENLREASLSQNQQNKKISVNNTSGVKGVVWNKKRQKWHVQLRVSGKQKFFGLYDNLELAQLVAQEARNTYHGQYARHF
jgi:hypothetical protein